MEKVKKKISIIVCFILVFMNLASCALKKEATDDNKFTIVASFYPIYALTNCVVQNANNVELINLTSGVGDCLHDYALLPSDVTKLETADVLIINGENTWKFSGKAEIINASENFTHSANNEHTWLSFDGAISQVKYIAQKLGQLDPSNAAIYMDNARDFEEKMKEKKTTYSIQLGKFENKNVAIAHEGFEYFLKDLGLNVIARTQDSHEEESTPDDIAITIGSIKDNNCGVIFVSENNKTVETIKSVLSQEGYLLEIIELSAITNGDGMSGDFFKQYDDNFEKVKSALEKAVENQSIMNEQKEQEGQTSED